MDLVNKDSDEGGSESSSSSEDEDPEEWTEETEKGFLKTLCYLKKKDPKIYDNNVKFFTDTASDIGTKTENSRNNNDSLYLRDYERKILLEKGGVLTDEETDSEDVIKKKRSLSPTYVEEQRRLKEGFKNILRDSDDEKSDDDSYKYSSDKCAGFLKIKKKTVQEKEKEEADYIEWLKGKKDELGDKAMETDLKYLRDYWSDPNLAEGEQFLRDYILNKRYLESDENDDDNEPSELKFSEEETMLNEHEEYEHKYNFRFEEPDREFIKTYPRVIEDSLRRKNEKRKKKRELAKQKKEKLLQEWSSELKKQKKIKKQELLQKIEKIKQATGNSRLGFEDIEGDFNPDEYDKKMSELFNEEFYDMDDDDAKPEFSDSDYDDGNYHTDKDNNPDNVDYDQDGTADDKFQQNSEELNESTYCYDTQNAIDVDNIDCDYDPSSARESKFKKQTRSARKKGHKKSQSVEALKKENPVFNPADKSFQQCVDEYYSMDFEDVIAGEIPCRFKYRKVVPNNYGLTIEEILAADDKELNNWCSMKKISTVRNEQSEVFDVQAYTKKAQNLDLKRKILPSLFKEQSENENNNATKSNNNNVESKPVENRGNTTGKKRSHNENTFIGKGKKKFKGDCASTNTVVSNEKQFRKNSVRRSDDISDERLKAYGINPKKYKNKIKYAPKR